MAAAHTLWDALKQTYDDTVEDAAEVPDEEGEAGVDNEEEWEKGVPPFVRKLTKMDPDSFSGTVLPKYFKSIKFCSFVRQLNMYGFHKVDDPTGVNSKHFEFKNSNFIPGKKELLKRIERRKAVKRSTRNDEDPSSKQQSFTGASNRGNKIVEPKLGSNVTDVERAGALKTILETIVKLQQQTEINQMALKQVLDELNFYRKSHFELEHKLNQYISQSAIANNQNNYGNGQNNYYRNPSTPPSVPQSPVPQSPQNLSSPSPSPPSPSPSPGPSPSHTVNYSSNISPALHPQHRPQSNPAAAILPLGLSLAETSNGMANGYIPAPPSVAKNKQHPQMQQQRPQQHPQMQQHYQSESQRYHFNPHEYPQMEVISVNGLPLDPHNTGRFNVASANGPNNIRSNPNGIPQQMSNSGNSIANERLNGMSIYANSGMNGNNQYTNSHLDGPQGNGKVISFTEELNKHDDHINLDTLQRQIGELDQQKLLMNLGPYDPYESHL